MICCWFSVLLLLFEIKVNIVLIEEHLLLNQIQAQVLVDDVVHVVNVP